MIFNCLLTGIGGQGTVTAARLIGTAATARDFDVKGANTIGVSRRGGSVVSHIRIGENISSPLIPRGEADLIIAFEPAEAVRVHSFLSPTGRVLVLDRGIMPLAVRLGEEHYAAKDMLGYLKTWLYHPSEQRLAQKDGGEWLIVIDTEKLIKKCGGSRLLNTALLGAAIRKKLLPLTEDDLKKAMRELLPPEYIEVNIRSFDAGGDLAG